MGFNVWWDEGLSPGAEWRQELTQVLQNCSLILFLVTPNSVASQQCSREITYGVDQFRRPVLAVHLLDTVVPDALGIILSDRQAIIRYAIESQDYERKLSTAIATYLDTPLSSGLPSTTSPFRASLQRQRWTLAVSCSLVVGSIVAIIMWITIPSRSE